MASTSTLLKLTPLQWNPPLSHTRQHRTLLFSSNHQHKPKPIRLQISLNYKQSDTNPNPNSDRNSNLNSDTNPNTYSDKSSNSDSDNKLIPYSDTNPNPYSDKNSNSDTNPNSGRIFDKIAIQIKKTFESLKKTAIAAVLLGLLLFYDPNYALAASGGRVGGSAFSSRSSRSSSSSRTYSAPRISDSGVRGGYSAPYYGPSPFGGGIVGPAIGFGFGGFSSFSLIFVGFAAFVLVSGFLSDRSDDGGGSVLTDTQKTSVVKLQVGLLGLGRTLQQDFNRLAESADTSTSEGLSYVLTEATLALLRHPDYCISCYSSVDVKRSIEDGEKRFNQLSIEERGKFDEETLVNVNSIKRSSKTQRASDFSNEYIVVTILVAAEGVHKLQPINASLDLKEALLKLGSIPRNKIMAVEVLWTPQNERDTLSERELLEDYPLLRPL